MSSCVSVAPDPVNLDELKHVSTRCNTRVCDGMAWDGMGWDEWKMDSRWAGRAASSYVHVLSHHTSTCMFMSMPILSRSCDRLSPSPPSSCRPSPPCLHRRNTPSRTSTCPCHVMSHVLRSVWRHVMSCHVISSSSLSDLDRYANTKHTTLSGTPLSTAIKQQQSSLTAVVSHAQPNQQNRRNTNTHHTRLATARASNSDSDSPTST